MNVPSQSSQWRQVILWIAVAALLRTLLACFVPLLPDETYYWLWTRHLEAGYQAAYHHYFDKLEPPAIRVAP